MRGGGSVSAERKEKPSAIIRASSNIPKKVSTSKVSKFLKEDPAPYGFTPTPAAPNWACTNAKSLRFIDLFCGIGGFRIAFERAGGKCVFSSDYDKFSQQTYEANFGELPQGDINEIEVADIPSHDILCAGFPCQPFSIAGVSKKNSLGRLHGFDDAKQGNLFFSIADILDHHRPTAFVLENVKNLKGHDKGKTFAIIKDTLESFLGYTIYTKVIDAKTLVPQHRERIFIVGFREKRDFEFPIFPEQGPLLGTILESRPDAKYTLTDHLWNYLQNYAAKHKAAGNGFGFGLVSKQDTTRTLSARYHKDGSEILIAQTGKNPRRLTPRECARLMGYPDDYKLVCSDTQAYRQFGNSVVVPVVARIAESVVAALKMPAENKLDLVLRDKTKPEDSHQLPICLYPNIRYPAKKGTITKK
jgi:DNA (cytosine-5)-methyltransferase 1